MLTCPSYRRMTDLGGSCTGGGHRDYPTRQLRGLVPLDVITDGERQRKGRGGVGRDRLHVARELSLANRQANAEEKEHDDQQHVRVQFRCTSFTEFGGRIVKGAGTRRVRTDADGCGDDLAGVTFEEQPGFFQTRRRPGDGDPRDLPGRLRSVHPAAPFGAAPGLRFPTGAESELEMNEHVPHRTIATAARLAAPRPGTPTPGHPLHAAGRSSCGSVRMSHPRR